MTRRQMKQRDQPKATRTETGNAGTGNARQNPGRAGRVVGVDGRCVRLAADGEQIDVALPDGPLPHVGDWVALHEPPSEAIAWRLLGRPRRPFPAPGSDWERLHRAGARVLSGLKMRAAVRRSVRRFFDARGYLEVETPTLVPSPGSDLHLAAFAVPEAEAYLITSPEYQMKRLVSGGLTHVYQLCRCFRRDERGSHHRREFTMLEFYRTGAGMDALITETEALISQVAEEVCGTRAIKRGEDDIDLTPPWPRLEVAQAFAEIAGVTPEALLPDEERFFRVLVEVVEPALARMGPVWLTHWPASMASLARLCPADRRYAERFELYVGGMELCNGFAELTDPREQEARLLADQRERAARGLPVYPLDRAFLRALEDGLPECAGNAVGVDRLVMLLAGVDDIAEVTAVDP